MERHFERALEELKETLVTMGGMVDVQLELACRSLFGGDTRQAHRVIAGDREIDRLDSLIERKCMDLFALAQPVAVDLRLLMAALAINSQLERIGDIAANIAERVEPLVPYQEFLLRTRLPEMADIARIMVRDSIDSLIRGDAALASRVLVSDDVVDKLDGGLFRSLVSSMQDQHDLIEPAAHCLILSRHLERLADHATNIAEDVIFIVEARQVKHNAGEEVRR